MTTRTTRNARGSVPIQYEDFQPKFDWKEEAGANILQIYLPGFNKEQLRLTYVHSSRTVRVTGERPLTNNKGTRFNQVFPVPQNCEVNKIHGKFHNGTLIITMPKAIITLVAPPKEKTTPATKATQEEAPPKATAPSPAAATASSSGSMTSQAPQKATSADAETPKGTGDMSRYGSTSTRADGPRSVDEKKAEAFGPEEVTRDVKSKMGLSDVPQKVDSTTEKSPLSTTTEASGKRVTEQLKERVRTTLSELDSSGKKTVELTAPALEKVRDSRKRKETSVVDDDQEKKRMKEDSFIGGRMKELSRNVASAAKRTVKGLCSINIEQMSGERRTMLNVGVAVLVIFAFGAYVYFSRRSSNDAKD